MEEETIIELTDHWAVISLPENSVEATITVKVFENSELLTVRKTYGMQEIREMFRKADEGYIDDDDTFVITEKGRKWLEEMGHDE